MAAVASAVTLVWLLSWGATIGRTPSSLLGTAPSLCSFTLSVGITGTLVGDFLITIHLSLTGCLEVGLGGVISEGIGVNVVGRAGATDTVGFVSLVWDFLVTIHLSLTGCLEVGLGVPVREGVRVVPAVCVELGVGVGVVVKAGTTGTSGFISGCGWSTAFMNGTIRLRNFLFRFVTVLLPSILIK